MKKQVNEGSEARISCEKTQKTTRRCFLRQSSLGVAGAIVGGSISARLRAQNRVAEGIELGVHHYSVRSLFQSGKLSLAAFPAFAREELGVSNIELAAELSLPLLESGALVRLLKVNADKANVQVLTLLCSGETALDGDTQSQREEAVQHHLRWVAVARALGCRFLRLRAGSEGDPKDRMEKARLGIQQLASHLKPGDPRLLIENVGGLSRRPEWLLGLIKTLGREHCGLLADYGNFEGDIYEGMKALLPHTESICTKSWDFDAEGNETKIDFLRMGRLIQASGFKGCISMEYLGKNLGSVAGLKKTAALVRSSLA